MTESINSVEEVVAQPADVVARESEFHELENVSQTIERGMDNSSSDQEKNWKAMREKLDRLQKENEENRSRSREYEELLFKIAQQQNSSSKEIEDEKFDIQPDDWLTYEQYEKLNEKRTKKMIQQALDEDRKMRAESEIPTRLQTQFPDFNSVVTEDNVKQLKAMEPEVAAALNKIDDKYAQAVAAYKYIKKLVPDAAEQTEYKERVQKNSSKPGSLSSVGSSSLSKATSFEKGLTPELKSQLFKEMQEASRRS